MSKLKRILTLAKYVLPSLPYRICLGDTFYSIGIWREGAIARAEYANSHEVILSASGNDYLEACSALLIKLQEYKKSIDKNDE